MMRDESGPIKEGESSFSSMLGRMRVEITAMRILEGKQGSVGGTPGDPIGPDNPADVYEQIIPAQYNSDTTLTVEVTADGDNQFDFELESGR